MISSIHVHRSEGHTFGCAATEEMYKVPKKGVSVQVYNCAKLTLSLVGPEVTSWHSCSTACRYVSRRQHAKRRNYCTPMKYLVDFRGVAKIYLLPFLSNWVL
jgi:hypothetical protein